MSTVVTECPGMSRTARLGTCYTRNARRFVDQRHADRAPLIMWLVVVSNRAHCTLSHSIVLHASAELHMYQLLPAAVCATWTYTSRLVCLQQTLTAGYAFLSWLYAALSSNLTAGGAGCFKNSSDVRYLQTTRACRQRWQTTRGYSLLNFNEMLHGLSFHHRVLKSSSMLLLLLLLLLLNCTCLLNTDQPLGSSKKFESAARISFCTKERLIRPIVCLSGCKEQSMSEEGDTGWRCDRCVFSGDTCLSG